MNMKQKNRLFVSLGFKIFLITVLTIITSASATYAYFYAGKRQSGLSTVTTACFDVSFNEGASISLENAASITDISGQQTDPYTFSITNNCENETAYTVILSTKTGSINDEFISVSLNKEPARVLSNVLENRVYEIDEEYSSSHILVKGYLKQDESATYDLRVWINALATYEDVRGLSWEGEVMVVNGIKQVEDMFMLSTKLPTLAKNTEIDVFASVSNDEGIHTLNDNDGPSYFYRGNSISNYLSFAGLSFRIVRLNGDGSLRIMYDGTEIHNNEEFSLDRVSNETVPSLIEGNENYLYTTLESWYEEKIINTGYDKYVANSSFCNDTIESLETLDLTCENKRTSKVGLLSLKEALASGASLNKANSNIYISRGTNFWLSTNYDDLNQYIFTSTGMIDKQELTENSSLVPVLNIDREYVDMITGSGTYSDPFSL